MDYFNPTMRLLTLWVFPLILVGCATSFFDRDQKNPVYHAGGDRIVPSLPSLSEGLKADTKPLKPEELAIGGVLASGVTLAMNRDYYKSSYISGRCRCVAEREPGFEIPCGTVTIVLTEVGGKEVSRITSEDGEFVFPVDKGRIYQLSAASPFYSSGNVDPRSLRMGDTVVLNLTPKVSQRAE